MNTNKIKEEKDDHVVERNRDAILNFITNNIIIDRFPVAKELQEGGKHSECNVVINVSDEFYIGNSEQIVNLGKLNYYFPLGETGVSMGISSIYGAMQILYHIYTFNPEWKVLIHCQAGMNRSPTIKAAFYFMMLGEHEPIEGNRLIINSEENRVLPPLPQLETFLTKCGYAFDNAHKFYGGIYDWILTESRL